MKNKTITFKRGKTSSKQVMQWHNEGYSVLCPLCKSELVFITSLEEAKIKAPGHPGIFCPKNSNHYSVSFYLKEARESIAAISQKYEIEEMTKNLRNKSYTEDQIQAEIDKYYPEI